jgi:hypothetical protein
LRAPVQAIVLAGPTQGQSVFDSLVDIAGIVQGGFFLRKKPLGIVPSVKTRIETALVARNPAFFEFHDGSCPAEDTSRLFT